ITLETGNNQLSITFDSTTLVATPTPTPGPFTGAPYRACLNEPIDIQNETGDTFTYTLHDLSGSQASFDIAFGSQVLCANPSLACTYGLNMESGENLAIAGATGIRVRITAIDLQDQCVDLLAGAGASTATCAESGPQVCGTNGVTYANACLAEEAGATWITEGACGLECTENYVPVCGPDFVTYQNACHARQAGAEPAVSGECPPTLTTNVPPGWSAIAPYGTGRLLAHTCEAGDGQNPFFAYSQTAGSWRRLPSSPVVPELSYPEAYELHGTQACTLRFLDAGTPTYAPTLSRGWNFVAGPPQAKTFDEVRGNCPAMTQPSSCPPVAVPDCINAYLAYPNGQTDANGCPVGGTCMACPSIAVPDCIGGILTY
ncbi:MAG: Kazal-type serine protease inhibitor domain-containing protein, partial [Candidatus Micrarchaeota archaeon]|nr:Kazal-type serine protease inhibitor domain-containing protein [Candidatus Micrarchaeota archaeon]